MDLTGARTSSFNFLLDKFKERLEGWKVKLLSPAGRVMLINSVLSALLTHIMQCTLIPQKKYARRWIE